MLEKGYIDGELAVELCPQGTLAERLRAAGAGIPAFYTPTGARTFMSPPFVSLKKKKVIYILTGKMSDTLLQEGQIPIRNNPSGGAPLENGHKRETRSFNGKLYLMETALPGDVAILRAYKADTAGNCVFRRTTRAFGPLMAKAAKLAIVEAEHIVPVGEIDPDDVHLPGIYVDRVVQATVEKQVETLKLREEPQGAADVQKKGSERKRTIAKRAAKELKEGYYVNLGVGIPTMAANYIPKERTVWLQSENGLLGMGPHPTPDEVDA